MKYRTDLTLGEAFSIFIFFYFLDSWLSVLNSLQLNFWLRDGENPQYDHFFLWTSWVDSASFLPRYLEYSVRPKKIRTQDTRSVILNVATHNPYGRQLTWQFIKLNWDFIMEKLVLLNLRLLVSG